MFTLLAATSKLADALTLLIVGMGVVFGALAILLAVVTLINRLTRTPPAVSAPRPSAVSATPALSGGPQDAQLVAVIAAAATAALGSQVRVNDIQPAAPEPPESKP